MNQFTGFPPSSIAVKCPNCGNLRSATKDTRHRVSDGTCIRRRQCVNCDRRFTTIEMSEDSPEFMLRKRVPKIRVMLASALALLPKELRDIEPEPADGQKRGEPKPPSVA